MAPEATADDAPSWISQAISHVLTVGTIVVANALFLFLYVWGLQVFPMLSAQYDSASELDSFGDSLILLGIVLLGVFYVFEMRRSCFLVWLLFFSASLMKGVMYPWASPLCVFFCMMFTLLQVRREHNRVGLTNFLLAAGITFLVCGFAVLFGWLYIRCRDVGMPTLRHIQGSVRQMSQSTDAKAVYDYFGVEYRTDCLREGPSATEAVAKKDADCAKANNIMVITWAIPLATFVLDFVFAVFNFIVYIMFFRGVTMDNLQLAARMFFAVNALLWGGFYVSTYTLEVSVNLTMPLLATLFVATIAAVKWVCLEGCSVSCPGEAGGEASHRSHCHGEGEHHCPVVRLFQRMKDSAWFRAIAVGSLFVPAFMSLEVLRQQRHRDDPPEDKRKHPEPASGPHTCEWAKFDEQARGLFDSIRAWEPAEVLDRICLLGETFFVLQVLGTKFTFVFLAWMNEVLADQYLVYVMLLGFSVGLFLLLLPPVPGVPVYIFCGIVVARQSVEELSFAGGCIAAIVLSLVLKLTACTLQYSIGAWLGHWDSVQRFVGKGTRVTESIERILDQKCSFHKVAILVGGPDWPTSVLCGILRVDLPWMLLGTLPCLFTAAPCVLAGAFLADKGEGERDRVHDFLGSFFTLLAAVVQTGSLLWATAAINAELTTLPYDIVDSKESGDGETFIVKWKELQPYMQFVLGAAAFLILTTGYAFVGLGGALFENFSVSGKIGDEVDEFGLGGNPFSILKPLGWLAILLCCIGMGLHLAFVLIPRMRPEEEWRQKQRVRQAASSPLPRS